MMPSSGSMQAQHLHMEVLLAPAKHDTIHRENQDSINTANFLRGASNWADRDTILFDGMRGGLRMQEEKLRRHDTTYYIKTILYHDRIERTSEDTGEKVSQKQYDAIKRSR